MSTPTPPSASEADRALAVSQLGVVIDWLRDGAGFHVSKNAKSSLGDVFETLIAAHTREAVSQAVGALEAELEIRTRQRDYWQEERQKLFKINGDLARMLDCEKQADSDRESLRACVVRLSGHVSMLLAKVEGRVHDENDTVEAAAKAELAALRPEAKGGA